MFLTEYFTDPILRGPTITSMLIGVAAALMGVLSFFQKRSLIGEVLSHAAFPGIILGLLLGAFHFEEKDLWVEVSALCLAFLSSIVGLYLIQFLTKKAKVHPDSALCFTLSGFFGLGVLGTSLIQQLSPERFRSAQTYLFGQTATLSDQHILFYALYALLIILLCVLYFPFFQITLFDPFFARSIGLHKKRYEILYQAFVAMTVVMSVRSVGVVLLSSLLVTPVVFAKGIARSFSSHLIISAIFGALISYFGVVLSLELPASLGISVLPTGPFIVTMGSLCAAFSLFFFSKKREKGRAQ